MSLLAASALGLLSLGALVTLVYFLKRQARDATVSTLFLWKGIERKPSSALRFRWRDLLSLALQLMALFAIVFGLAQPVLFSSASGVAKMALLIDSSASMRALVDQNDSTESRYAQAVRAANELLNQNPAAEVMAIRVQEQSELLARPSRDHGALKRLLAASEPSFQGDGDLGNLFGLLQSQETRDFERIVFITDHQPSVDVGAFGWEVMQIGDGSLANTAITELSVREQPNGQGYDIYVEVVNSSPKDVSLPLYVYARDELIRQETIELASGETTARSYQEQSTTDRRFRVQWGDDEYTDQWVEDNVRYATLPTADPWRILWVGPDNIYLTRFLDLSDEINLERRSAWDESINPDVYDAVILYNIDAPSPIAGRYILINSSMSPWVSQAESIELNDDQAVSVRLDHPFLHNIDPTVWRFLNIPNATVDSQGKVILSIGEHPVLYIHEKAGLRLAYMGASLDTSNLVLSVDFPILVYRIISWLAPRMGQSTTLIAGSEIPVSESTDRTTVIDSGGHTCNYAEGTSTCGRVDRPGFYQVFSDGVPVIYAVNPNSNESLGVEQSIQDNSNEFASAITGGIQASAANSTQLQVGTGIWPYLVALGLALLVAEYIIFDRSLLVFRRIVRRKSL